MCKREEFDKSRSLAQLSERISADADRLSFEDQQIVYMFFACDLTISDISHICQCGPEEALLVVIAFLAGLVFVCRALPGLFVSSSLPNLPKGDRHSTGGEWTRPDLANWLLLFLQMERVRVITGARLVDLIGPSLDRNSSHSVCSPQAEVGIKLRCCSHA